MARFFRIDNAIATERTHDGQIISSSSVGLTTLLANLRGDGFQTVVERRPVRDPQTLSIVREQIVVAAYR
jgi:hypothetical protein